MLSFRQMETDVDVYQGKQLECVKVGSYLGKYIMLYVLHL